jgi:ankyrin repeat protein
MPPEYKAYSLNENILLTRLLLELGINPNDKDNVFKQTPLLAAIGFDNEPFALALLSFSDHIDLNEACSESWCATTPLLMAIQRGLTKVSEELIKLGADVNKTDKFGMTPLHWAMIMGDDKTMELLLSNKNILLKKAANGKYPLDYLNIAKRDLAPPEVRKMNETLRPEFRPIVAHFWGKRDDFFVFRESHKAAIENCAKQLHAWQLKNDVSDTLQMLVKEEKIRKMLK